MPEPSAARRRVGLREFVREWVYETFQAPSREEVQRWWDEGVPVQVRPVMPYEQSLYRPHTTSCPMTATGHLGRCTCGADPRG